MAKKLWPALLIVAVLFLIASWFATNIYDNYLSYPILFVLALIFVLIVLAYQFWAYKLFKGKVTREDLAYEEAY